jgi:hypothetical protein
MKKFIVILALIHLFYSISPASLPIETPAADCALATVKAEYKNSKAVFVGKVMNVSEDGDSKTFEFKVEKYWKGVKGGKIKIKVSKTMRFEPFYQTGKSYLIYAFADNDGFLHTAKCTRGFQLEFAKEDLKILGKAKKIR